MASYLLNASEEEMERWKREAALAGMSFAAYIRAALETYSGRDARSQLPQLNMLDASSELLDSYL